MEPKNPQVGLNRLTHSTIPPFLKPAGEWTSLDLPHWATQIEPLEEFLEPLPVHRTGPCETKERDRTWKLKEGPKTWDHKLSIERQVRRRRRNRLSHDNTTIRYSDWKCSSFSVSKLMRNCLVISAHRELRQLWSRWNSGGERKPREDGGWCRSGPLRLPFQANSERALRGLMPWS